MANNSSNGIQRGKHVASCSGGFLRVCMMAAVLAPGIASAHEAIIVTDTATVPLLAVETQQQLQSLLESLNDAGVAGLCHPTLDIYAPAFPHCSSSDDDGYYHQATTTSRSTAERTRATRDLEAYMDENAVTQSQWYGLIDAGLAFLCVIMGALAAGLTVGLLSLDPMLLVIKIRAGETQEQRDQAARLLPIVKQHHRLLVTLLLLNTIAGEALPIFLQGMVPDSIAILLSVVLVLVFGEILPTAMFTGPNQLKMASQLAPLVQFLMFIFTPISYPMARLLDKIMSDGSGDGGDDGGGGGHGGGNMFNRGELAAMVRVQHEERVIAKQRRNHQRKTSLHNIPATAPETTAVTDIHSANDLRVLKLGLIQHMDHLHDAAGNNTNGNDNINNNNNNATTNNSNGSDPYHDIRKQHSKASDRDPQAQSDSIDGDEVTMIEGALQMKTKTAMDIYLSFHKVFCIPHDMVLTDSNIFTIYASGYSRVPVYCNKDRQRIKGILMTRQLMVVKQQQQQKRRNSGQLLDPLSVEEEASISDLNLHVPQCVAPSTNLISLVNLFQTGGSAVRAGHMALVCARPDIANAALDRDEALPPEAGLMGIITLEDVLEALLQEQIYDEMDVAGRMVMSPLDEELDVDVEIAVNEAGGYHLA